MTFYQLSSAGIQSRIDRRIYLSAFSLSFILLNLFYFLLWPLFGFSWIVLGILAAGFWITLEYLGTVFREMEALRSAAYRIGYSPQRLTLVALNKATVSLDRSNVKKIIRTPRGLIVWESSFRYDKILVPNTIENYEFLSIKLGSWQEIVEKKEGDWSMLLGGTSYFLLVSSWVSFLLKGAWELTAVVAAVSLILGAASFLWSRLGFSQWGREETEREYLVLALILVVFNGIALAGALIIRY